MHKRIEDYALIGDCQSAALVGKDGSIDWLCWPRFDSGALFAALLGDCSNGRWSIGAAGPSQNRRRYRGNTLVLETEIEAAGGAVSLIDFMPVRTGDAVHLVRILRGLRGEVAMVTEFVLRFDYGLIVPWITRMEDGIKAVAGPDMVTLRTKAPLEAEGFKHCGRFMVKAGETVPFILSYGSSFRPESQAIDPLKALDDTEKAWEEWSQAGTVSGPHAGAVMRSLITLKALTYHPTGGIAAAPTTSLPEEIGGSRNWDYRHCWLRDATFTLVALLNSGFHREADRWRDWLRRAVAGSPQQMQIVYGLAGERRLTEIEIPWLSGYENSKPVRIGNAASTQLQIDVYGEVMDALFQRTVSSINPTHEIWPLQQTLLKHLEDVWHYPDEGIWEVRGGPRHFTHSKVMAWVAFDRAIKTIERFGVEGPLERWRGVRDQIHAQVCENGFDASLGTFVQSYGSRALDASALLISLVGFLPPDDPRIRSTVDAIGAQLKVDGLIRRYETRTSSDGIVGGEGAFLTCSFWYADNLTLLGRKDEARELFDYLLSLRNDVGLLSEEYDPVAGRMLGNFPQAFSHVSLVNTAHSLFRAKEPVAQRPEGHLSS